MATTRPGAPPRAAKSAAKPASKPAAKHSSRPRGLAPPQKLSPAARKAATQGIPAAEARAVARSEPVAPKIKRGKTARPLAKERIAALLDALRRTYPNVVLAGGLTTPQLAVRSLLAAFSSAALLLLLDRSDGSLRTSCCAVSAANSVSKLSNGA